MLVGELLLITQQFWNILNSTDINWLTFYQEQKDLGKRAQEVQGVKMCKQGVKRQFQLRKHHQKGSWKQNRWHLGAFTKEQSKPSAWALTAGRSGPSISTGAGRHWAQQQDFQRMEPLPCMERPNWGCLVWRGEGGVGCS